MRGRGEEEGGEGWEGGRRKKGRKEGEEERKRKIREAKRETESFPSVLVSFQLYKYNLCRRIKKI